MEVIGQILHVEPEPPSTHRPGLDPRLEAICLKAMAKDPAARFTSMRELADALLAFASEAPASRTASASAETAKGATETQRIAEVFAFTEQAVEKAIRKHRTPTWMKIAIAFLGVMSVVVPSVVFIIRPSKAQVDLTVVIKDVDLNDKSLTFFLDEEPVSADVLAKPVELKRGDHVFTVKRGKTIIKRMLLTVSGGWSPGIKTKDITPPPEVLPPVDPPKDDGFVPLFNGKNLSGWQTHSSQPGNWRVENGLLVGSGGKGAGVSHLYTVRDDYRDFHLRMEARLINGSSGVCFRAPFGPTFPEKTPNWLGAYNAKIDKTRFGGLLVDGVPGRTLQRDQVLPYEFGQWITFEILVRGNHIEIKVNGMKTADYVDREKTYTSGRIALQQHGPQTVIEFRKIEIKKLPPAAEEGFVPLFNGKDFTGWQSTNGQPVLGGWEITGGTIVRRLTDKEGFDIWTINRYGDFILELEYMSTGNSGIFLRDSTKDSNRVEVQIHAPGRGIDKESVGAFCYFQAPLKENAKNDDWNKVRITAKGRIVTVEMNGEKVNEIDLDRWTEADKNPDGTSSATRPGANHTIAPKNFARRGHIGLQAHAGQVSYRNLRIKELAPAAELGFVPLFNGKDLTGWKEVGVKGGYSVTGACLQIDAPGYDKPGERRGWLVTEKDYTDFVLRLQYATEVGADSGVAIRCDPAFDTQAEITFCDETDPFIAKLIGNNPTLRSGGLSQFASDRAAPLRARGEWNDLIVELVGRKLKATLNGTVTVDADLDRLTDKAGGKKGERPGFTRRTGPIGLQKQAGSVRFRNVEIRELAPPAEQGFVPLFNGKDLAGWKGLPGAWKLDGDDLVGHLPADHKRNSFLWAKKPYKNFELKFQVKLHNGTGNSGVQIRSRINDEAEYRIAGPQVEIDAINGLGGLYGEGDGGWKKQAPEAIVRKVYKPGEFNDYHVTVNGKRVKIVVNGSTLVDDDFPTMANEGLLAFQLHGALLRDDVTFRNIRIKELTPPAEQGFVPLFNGKDLTGWKAVGAPKWTWADGRLLGSPAPGGGFLVTEAEYEDFELELQYRLAAVAGSGVFLRCDPTGPASGKDQMELQIIDDDSFNSGPLNATGSIWNVFRRKTVPPIKRGDWNAVRVRLKGRHIEVWINGVQTIDADLDSAGGKLATVPGLTRTKGGIGLQQNQKSDVEFRNVRIKELRK